MVDGDAVELTKAFSFEKAFAWLRLANPAGGGSERFCYPYRSMREVHR